MAEKFRENDRIVIQYPCFIDKIFPVMFIGTESGQLYGIPLCFYTNRKFLQVYHLDLSQGRQINFIQLFQNQLIVSQQSSQCTILRLQNFHEKFKGSLGSEIEADRGDGEVQRELIIVDLEGCVIFRKQLSENIKRI